MATYKQYDALAIGDLLRAPVTGPFLAAIDAIRMQYLEYYPTRLRKPSALPTYCTRVNTNLGVEAVQGVIIDEPGRRTENLLVDLGALAAHRGASLSEYAALEFDWAVDRVHRIDDRLEARVHTVVSFAPGVLTSYL